MDVPFTAERKSDDSLSTAMPVWTNLTSAENKDAVLSMATSIFTDLRYNHGSSTASRTTGVQSKTETPAHMETTKTDSTSSVSEDPNVMTNHLEPDSVVEISLRESKTSSAVSAQNFVFPAGVVNGSMLETTVHAESKEDSFLLSKSRNFTTAMPLRDNNMVRSKQPLEVSRVHMPEHTQKALILDDADVARDAAGHVTANLPFSTALHLSVSAALQKSSSAAETSVAHGQFSSSSSQFTVVRSSVASSSGYSDEYTSVAYHNGFHMNDTSGVMKTPVNSSNSVAFTAVVSVGIVFGFFVTFIVTVSLIIIFRRRRKTDNLQTSYVCVQQEKSLLPSRMFSTGMDYTEVTRPMLRHSIVHKADQVFLLPCEQVVHNTSDDRNIEYNDDEDGLFNELDRLVHVDTDMSSLLQIMDRHLFQHSRRSAASDDTSGYSRVDTEHLSQNSTTMSDNQYNHPDVYCGFDDCPVPQTFHEYDPVYVPHNDAAAMARRVDDETSYVRTLQSRHNSSPYEEVCYGIRPLLLSDHPPMHVHQQPIVPPRTSSIAQSHLQNSGSNRMVAEQIDVSHADGTDPLAELSHRISTASDVE